MTTSSDVMVVQAAVDNTDITDMFADLPPLDPFEVKKDEIASQLAAMMSYAATNRSALAEKLNWKKSRLTQVLSGKGNSTIRTIFEFSSCLGFDFDLVFRLHSEERAVQPWQKATSKLSVVKTSLETPRVLYALVAQTADEVVADIANGKRKSIYISAKLLSNRDQFSSPTIDSGDHQLQASSGGQWISTPMIGSQGSHLPVRVLTSN